MGTSGTYRRLCAAALIALFTGCATSPKTSIRDDLNDVSEHLAVQAKTAGIDIVRDRSVTVVQDGVVFVGTTVRGLEKIPAPAYRDGVDIGFAYIRVPGSDLPVGYFLIRAQSNDIRLGEVRGRMIFIRRDGTTAFELPAKLRIDSLRVPEGLDPPYAVLHARVHLAEDSLTSGTVVFDEWCENGVHVTTEPEDFDSSDDGFQDDDPPSG